ncbi:hypothetical protein ASE75_02190 [Sphingomonas sp. Leaf17]|uniref:PAS domain-containing protein n=1 Tax=Sphingomonas sp. Leaf17 TaxID=1735683 RepID=UPI0006FD56C1|nr:PAS domain-containing protein [Sphingomonas sp. Leaf17]KQM67743.1 hypothetical protein ASE75_02190 [Sphingomonas sp. Leaf17]
MTFRDDAPTDHSPASTESRYRSLFDAVETGFCIVEMVFDGDTARDYRFVEVNAAFERQTGLVDPVGRLANELVPDLEQHWFDIYGMVARTGETVRFENGSAAMDRWFEVQALRVGGPGSNEVAILFEDISLRRHGERALRESEERLRQALSVGKGVGTWKWHTASDRVVADAQFAKLYRVDPEEALRGAPLSVFTDAMDPADRPRVEAAIAASVETGAPYSQEYRLLTADGNIRWVLAQGRCNYDATGRPTDFPGMVFDITDRKSAEIRQAALLALSDRLRDLTDPDEIAYAASEILGQALRVSRVGYGIIDKVAETITIARDWNAPGITTIAGVLHFRDFGTYIEDLKTGRTAIVSNADEDPRTPGASADALKRISAWSFVNMPLVEHGRFVALIYANHERPRVWTDDDILLIREVAERVHVASERVRAEQARWQSDEQFRMFAQTLPDHLWMARPDGYIYWFSDRLLTYCGRPLDDLVGTNAWGVVVHPDDLPAAGAAWAQALETGTTYATEMRIRAADGGYRWFLVRAEALRDVDGTILRWMGANTDIDERRRQSAELARLNATLEDQVAERTRELMAAEEALRQSQKMEAVGQLTGGLAHDFNNLLTGVLGSLELLGIRMAQGRLADVERYSLAAQGAARRAAALTHRLLAFSRRQTLDPRPTDVNRLIAGLEDMVRRTVGPQVTVEVVAAGGLWPTLVDPNQLENALLNLCINARDAMPGGGRLTIETANRWLDERGALGRELPPGQYVSICVSDTGTGMTPDVIAKAFDPFFTTKPIGLGTGLGLSMIYGFARQSGGQVRIYSEVGEGSNICVYLPRHNGPADAIGEDQTRTIEPQATTGETVLVVDDEPTVRMLVVEVLEELGYAALEAGDGAAGLEILRSDARIDLLVTDVGLPGGMNGRQMVDAARVDRPDLPVLFITGYAENAVLGNGQLEAGMHVMTKPFGMDALADRIRGLIAG